MSLLNPWVLLGLVLSHGLLAGYTWLEATDRANDRHVSDQVKAVVLVMNRSAAAAAAGVREGAARAALNRSIDVEVSRYVASDGARAACFDADGLRLIRAVARGEPTVPAVPGRALPERDAGARGR